jgi:dienelactone hydrolase
VFGSSLGEQKADLTPLTPHIKGSLLILQGHEDPLATQEEMQVALKEFTEAGIDWQMHLYGHAMHAFTNPEAHDAQAGLLFDPKANIRSWHAMTNFFEETFTTG